MLTLAFITRRIEAKDLPTVFIAISSHSVDAFSMYTKVASTRPGIQLCFPVKWKASCIASSSLRPNMVSEEVRLWLPL